jgi:DNA-directed RNA polymerase alpha subunit
MEIEAMIPEPEEWDVDPDDFIALMSWNDEDETNIDVSQFVGQTFDPTSPAEGDAEVATLDADGVASGDIDFSKLDLSDITAPDVAEESAKTVDAAKAVDFSALDALSEADEDSAAGEVTKAGADPMSELLSPGHDVSLKDIGVSTRWVTKFAEGGIGNVADLENKTADELKELPGIGDSAVAEVEKGLEAGGYPPLI